MKVAIVGAGPSGAFTAWLLKNAGINKVLLFDKNEFPRIKPCAGGISPAAIKLLEKYGFLKEIRKIANEITALKLHVKDNSIVLKGGLSALVLNRKLFDNILVEKAISLGVEFYPKTKIEGLLVDKNRVFGVKSEDKEWEADIVIIAEGGRGFFSIDPRKKQYLEAMIAWFEGVELNPNTIAMFYFEPIIPHYGWIFPEGNGIFNLGLCRLQNKGGKPLINIFKDFVDNISDRYLKKANRITSIYSHPIVYCTKPAYLVDTNMIWIGEAGRLSDPTTGEGIYGGLKSGELAVKYLIMSKNKFDLRYLKLYEREIEVRFGIRNSVSMFMNKAISAGFLNLLIEGSRVRWVNSVASKLMASI